MPKPHLLKHSSGTITPIVGGDTRGIHTSLKVNAIAWLEFELGNYDVAVQHVNHYATLSIGQLDLFPDDSY